MSIGIANRYRRWAVLIYLLFLLVSLVIARFFFLFLTCLYLYMIAMPIATPPSPETRNNRFTFGQNAHAMWTVPAIIQSTPHRPKRAFAIPPFFFSISCSCIKTFSFHKPTFHRTILTIAARNSRENSYLASRISYLGWIPATSLRGHKLRGNDRHRGTGHGLRDSHLLPPFGCDAISRVS